MERMMERKFSGHVCASICPNLYVLLLFLSGSPMCDRDNKLLLCFIKRTQKPKKCDCCKVLGNSTTFLLHCTLSVMRIEKGQGIVDDCPFPCLNTRIHIFTQCLWFNGSDHLGARFCFCRQSRLLFRTDLGHWDHKERTSDERGDNKSPLALSSLLYQIKQ